MKKSLVFMAIVAFFALLFSSCGSHALSLDTNVPGSALTEEYCIKMVRDYWDCSKGAHYSAIYSNGNYLRREYGCKEGDRGNLMSVINDVFNDNIEIDVSESYYNNYILKICAHSKDQWPVSTDYYIEVIF